MQFEGQLTKTHSVDNLASRSYQTGSKKCTVKRQLLQTSERVPRQACLVQVSQHVALQHCPKILRVTWPSIVLQGIFIFPHK